MNCNNSVSIEVSLSNEDAIINNPALEVDKMARPHTADCSSTSKDKNTPPLMKAVDAAKLERVGMNPEQKRNFDRCLPMSEASAKDDGPTRDLDLKSGIKCGQVSDDGRSSVTDDSHLRSRNPGSNLQPTDLPQPSYHSSPKHQRSDNRGDTMGFHSNTRSYPSSKSSSPMRKSTSHLSNHTRSSIRSEGPVCRICHEGDHSEVLISPCYCAGSLGLLHISCLQRWLGASNKTTCEICNFQFTLTRRAKPIKEFLKDPGSSRDRQNLICDIVSFLLITPLTSLTTWFSIVGAYKYYQDSNWEKSWLISLAIILWCLYLIWFMVAVRHNWRLWKDWVKFHQDVTLICSPVTAQHSHVVEESSEKVSSHTTLSSGNIHLQTIEIKFNGPLMNQKGKKRTEQSKLASSSSIPESQVGTSEDNSSPKCGKKDIHNKNQAKTRSYSRSGRINENHHPWTSSRQGHCQGENFSQSNQLQGKYLPETKTRQGRYIPDTSMRHGRDHHETTMGQENHCHETSARHGNYLPETKMRPNNHPSKSNARQGNYYYETERRHDTYLPVASSEQDNHSPDAKVGRPVLHVYENPRYRKYYDNTVANEYKHLPDLNRDPWKEAVPAPWKNPDSTAPWKNPESTVPGKNPEITASSKTPESTTSRKPLESTASRKTPESTAPWEFPESTASCKNQESTAPWEIPESTAPGKNPESTTPWKNPECTALWKNPVCNCDAQDPGCDKFCDSAAIFSRGNSPEEHDNKTPSQKYTEDWLDWKTVALNSKADDSQQSQGTEEGSYYTCSENRSPDKKDASME